MSLTAKQIIYNWTSFDVEQMEGVHGFRVSNLNKQSTCYDHNDGGKGHSCLKATFTLQRQLGHYLIRVYGPSLLIVITTFIGFFIPAQGYPARVYSMFCSLAKLNIVYISCRLCCRR